MRITHSRFVELVAEVLRETAGPESSQPNRRIQPSDYSCTRFLELKGRYDESLKTLKDLRAELDDLDPDSQEWQDAIAKRTQVTITHRTNTTKMEVFVRDASNLENPPEWLGIDPKFDVISSGSVWDKIAAKCEQDEAIDEAISLTPVDIRRIISEELEIHFAPEDLESMDPEEAYGMGYEQGRSFDSDPDLDDDGFLSVAELIRMTHDIVDDIDAHSDQRDQSYIFESRYSGMTIQEMFSYLDGFGNDTWIFFDTETTGLTSHNRQITEIAAVAASPRDWTQDPEILGTFNVKIKLSQDTLDFMQDERDAAAQPGAKKKRGMTIPDILSMTRYGEQGREYLDEQEAIGKFLEFVESYSSPVLVAQNAQFDMNFVSTRSDTRIKRYPVIDTMKIMQLFLIPLLITLRKPPHSDQAAADFLEKIKRRGRYSASMGVVSQAYGISTDEWHNALADVQMMMQMFKHVMTTLKSNASIDISRSHGRSAAYHHKMKKRGR